MMDSSPEWCEVFASPSMGEAGTKCRVRVIGAAAPDRVANNTRLLEAATAR